MKRLLIISVIVAAAAAAGVAIAATNGGSGTTKSGRATVSVKRISGAGSVLVDSRGRALYKNEQEQGSAVLCKGACVSFWKPLVVHGKPKGKSLPGKLGVAKRPGGARQVTYRASGCTRSRWTSLGRSPATASWTRSVATSSPGM